VYLHQYSLRGSWCNLDKLTLAIYAIITLCAQIIDSVRVAIIAGHTGSWRAFLTVCILTIVVICIQDANISNCARVVVIAWPTTCWGPPAERKFAIIGAVAGIIRGAGVVIIAWLPGGGRSYARNAWEPINSGRRNTSIVYRADLEIIACSIEHGRSCTERVLAVFRQDTGVFVCALVVVIADAASKRCATADCEVIVFRLRTDIILCASCVVIARAACHECSAAFEECWEVVIVKSVRNFCAHVLISAVVLVVAGLACCKRATAASTGFEEDAGGDSHALVVDAAVFVVVAGLANINVSQAHRHVSVVC
jgi:hypothetical protein